MADTVEEVYVWSGDDWVPVVRDATVEKTSELTNDGEDGVNPFITAADIPAVPDKELPIDSTDGTVVLDSPSANTFTISTGGAASIELGAAARISTDGEGRVQVSDRFPLYVYNQSGSSYDASGSNTSGVLVVHNVSGTGITRCSAFDGTLNVSGTVADLSIYNARNVNFTGSGDVVNVYSGFKVNNLDTKGSIQAGYVSEVDVSGSQERYQFYGSGSAPSYFGGDIQTSRIVGSTAPNSDASIELGANFTATAGSAFFELRTGGNCGIGTNGEGLKARLDVNGTIAAKPTATTDQVDSGVPTIINREMTAGGVYSGISFFQDVDAVGISIANRSKLIISEDDIRAVDSYTPTQPNSIATKQTVDDKIWVGTTAEYNAIATKNPTTLYCLTD